MPVLHKKLGRDLRESLGVLITVVAIIGVGTGCFIGFSSAQRILESSQAAYYEDYRFADFWVDVKKAPLSATAKIAALPTVAEIETRVVFDVILDLPNIARPLTGRLISTPATRFDQSINGICLIRGSGFSPSPPTTGEEIIISEAFANAHQLNPGDRVELILNRKRESFIIVGTAISPEYVYMVRGQGDFVPDPEHFATLYIQQRRARELLDFQDACNQIVGRLMPGQEQYVDQTLDQIDRILDPYGVLATTPRKRQASNRFLSDEINGLSVTAVVMPAIFLLVAALVLNILMSRMAERQRTIIGTLKALGYSDRQVLTHFLSFGLTVGIAGGIAGSGVGLTLSKAMVTMYQGFFQFPRFTHAVYPNLHLIGLAISVVFAIAGTAKGVWTVLKLAPAEAMRSKPPQQGGAVFLERFPRLWKSIGFRGHIALRGLARHKGRTITGVVSQAFAIAIILLTFALYDSMWHLVVFQFDKIAHSDVDIGMRDEKSTAALLEARQLPGVTYAEPILGMTCDARSNAVSRRITITGLSDKHRLTTPSQADGSHIEIPQTGLVMSNKLAEILNLKPGDYLEITPVRGQRTTVRAYLTSTIESFLGLDCYANINYLSQLVGEAYAINSLQLNVDSASQTDLFHYIKQLPNAQGVSLRTDTKNSVETTFVGTMSATLGITILFAGVIAFGSVINSSMIEIADRTRDISTFRVLGYTPRQIAGIFFRQNLIVFALGLTLAIPLGYWLVLASAQAYATELFRMPVIIKPMAIATTAAISLAFVLVAQWFVHRRIAKLDWLEGIKVKE